MSDKNGPLHIEKFDGEKFYDATDEVMAQIRADKPAEHSPAEWRHVPSDSHYQVSSDGEVRGPRGKILKPAADPCGYDRVSLSGKTVSVHGLVLEAFVGPRPYGMQSNHRDGDKSNNRRENLEYVTPSENTRHAWAMGLSKKQVGTDNGRAKLDEEKVLAIRELAAGGVSQRTLAGRFSVSKATIWRVVTRQDWAEVESKKLREGK